MKSLIIFFSNSLLSYQRPIELRKGILREGTFKYVTHNNYNYGEEIFFHPNYVQDNNYNDYLRKIVSYFVKKDEPTLILFLTRQDTRRWSGCSANQTRPLARMIIGKSVNWQIGKLIYW